jgi:hypothetical protein
VGIGGKDEGIGGTVINLMAGKPLMVAGDTVAGKWKRRRPARLSRAGRAPQCYEH